MSEQGSWGEGEVYLSSELVALKITWGLEKPKLPSLLCRGGGHQWGLVGQ